MMFFLCRVVIGWRKSQKLNSIGGRDRGRPKKTWAEVIHMDCLALGLIETHPSDRKLGVADLEVLLDWTHPYTRD